MMVKPGLTLTVCLMTLGVQQVVLDEAGTRCRRRRWRCPWGPFGKCYECDHDPGDRGAHHGDEVQEAITEKPSQRKQWRVRDPEDTQPDIGTDPGHNRSDQVAEHEPADPLEDLSLVSSPTRSSNGRRQYRGH